MLDGGVADNIGLRGPLVAIRSNDLPWNLPNMVNQGIVKKIVVIMVDARTAPESKIDAKPDGPAVTTIMDTIASVPMGNYSFDTVQGLLDTFDQWKKDRSAYASCEKRLQQACAAGMPTDPPKPLDTYGIYVGFDQIRNEADKAHFLNLPTTFQLPKEEVNALRKIGGRILDESENFQLLLKELKLPR